MLIGQYFNTVDEKGRLLIPAKLRSEIAGSSVVVAHGIDRCLRIYPLDKWESVVREILGAGSSYALESRFLKRALISTASSLDVDKSGRILLPPGLREESAVIKDAVVLGSVDYIEVWGVETYGLFWDTEKYEASLTQKEQQIRVATEKIDNFYNSINNGNNE